MRVQFSLRGDGCCDVSCFLQPLLMALPGMENIYSDLESVVRCIVIQLTDLYSIVIVTYAVYLNESM